MSWTVCLYQFRIHAFFLSNPSASSQTPVNKEKRLKDFLPETLQSDVEVSAFYHKSEIVCRICFYKYFQCVFILLQYPYPVPVRVVSLFRRIPASVHK